MAKAIYYNEHLKGKEFDVLKKNEDGTLEIGTGKVLVVGKCPVSEKPEHGKAVLVLEEVKPTETKK